MKRAMLSALIVCAVCLLTVAPLGAQVDRATLSGLVTDSSGGVIFRRHRHRHEPGFGFIEWRSDNGISNCNGLDLGLERRFQRGLAFGFAYTFGESDDNASEQLTTQGSRSARTPSRRTGRSRASTSRTPATRSP